MKKTKIVRATKIAKALCYCCNLTRTKSTTGLCARCQRMHDRSLAS